MTYGYYTRTGFRSFRTIEACRKSITMAMVRSQDEYEIINKKNGKDVLIGFVYEDAEVGGFTRYQPKNSKNSYPIKKDGTLSRKGMYEVIL